MARPIRIQYPGAVYHVMARGNHGQKIFADDADRKTFLAVLTEACAKTGWRIHAYVLMANHYHLLLQTPEPNLVDGMKWLQGVYTLRHNSRHKVRGHLFQGRYKAIPVETADGAGDYFGVVSTYIHLNPARAGLIRPGEQKLKRYRWSSYPWYLARANRRPKWLEVNRVMAGLNLGPGEGRGYEACLEGRVLELATRAGRKEWEREWKALRRGWYVGGASFLEQLEERLEEAIAGRRRESLSGQAKASHDEAGAEKILGAGMRLLGLSETDLHELNHGALEKVALAWWLRRRTTVSLRWVSERLRMGHYSRVSQSVSRMEHQPARKLKKLRDQLSRGSE